MWINEDKLIILNQYDRACMHLVCRVMPSGKIICGNCGQDLKESGMATWEYVPGIADVEIMLEQLKLIFTLHDKVVTKKGEKIERLKRIIEKYKEKQA